MAAGARGVDGYFGSIGYSAGFWTSSQSVSEFSSQRTLEYINDDLAPYSVPVNVGYAVRCIMD